MTFETEREENKNHIVNHEEVAKDLEYIKTRDNDLYNKMVGLVNKIESAPDTSCLKFLHIQNGLQWQHICGTVAEMRAFADVASDHLKGKGGEGQNDGLKMFENISESFKNLQKGYDTWFEQGAPFVGPLWEDFCDVSGNAYDSYRELASELGK